MKFTLRSQLRRFSVTEGVAGVEFAIKTWSAQGNLIPGLHLNNMTMQVATTMRME
jgi:hypothetical protein